MKKTTLLLLLCGAITTHADVTLPKAIDSKMVLQRDREVPIWGWADQGEEVTVEFAGQVKKALPDASGKWMLKLDPMPASAESRTIIGYTATHVIVINDKKFAYLGSEFVSEIKPIDPDQDLNQDNNLGNKTQICYPFSPTDFFVSPELLKIKELPSHVHYKTAYFSMACLIIYALLNNDDFYTEYLQHHQSDKIIAALHPHPINGTKLYWLLSRCLLEDPERRTILLI